jgi:uroporphyrinogen III methyltransferase/synthase
LPRDTPAAAVQWGTHNRQQTVVSTIAGLAEAASARGLTAPVISIIGKAVTLRDEIGWFESRPLFGKRVVVTRASAMPGTLSALLRGRGADVIEAPSTEIEPLDEAALNAAVAEIASYDWLVLTSATGVRFFAKALDRAGLDARALSHTDVAVIGPSTGKALREIGIKPDLLPQRFVAESLLESMRGLQGLAGSRILVSTAEDGRSVLPDGLRELGAHVDVVHMYRSRLVTEGAEVEALRAALDSGQVDAVTFTSASTVQGFVAQVGKERAREAKAISIGPVTSAAVREAGMSVLAESAEATVPALAESVVAALSR